MSSRPQLPPTKGENADVNAIAHYFDHVFKHDTPYRIQLRSTWNRARLYLRSRQWIEPVGGRTSDDPNWIPIRQALNGIPMPVQNELFPIITGEAARLVGVGSRPYVRPGDDDPRVEEACQVGKDVLIDSCDNDGWLEQQQDGAWQMAAYGTWYAAQWLDVDYTKTTRVPVAGAMRCPQCDFRLRNAEIGEDDAVGLLRSRPDAVRIDDVADVEETSSSNSLVEPHRTYTVTHCPVCDTHEEDGLVPAEEPAGAEMGESGLTYPDEPLGDAALDAEAGPSSPDMPLEEALEGDDTGEDEAAEGEAFAPPLPPAPLGPAMVPGRVQAPGAPALEPYAVDEEECKTAKDFLGRPLGDDVPQVDVASECLSIFGAFPEPSSQGVGATPNNWSEFGWEVPRSLDYLANHFENGVLVEPQSSDHIYENHPIVSNVDGLTLAPGPNVFSNHALTRYLVRKPKRVRTVDKETGEETVKVDRGRLVIMANRTLLLDADLMVESAENPGQLIPRFVFDWCQWEKADQESHGVGMCEIAFSKQDSINTQLSQVIQTRHNQGNPKWLLNTGITMDYQGGANSGYTSDFLFMTKSSPEIPDPIKFGDTLFNNDVWHEHQNDVEAIQRVLMTREVESGEPPKSVDAYSALLLLAQKAAEGRKPRLERIRSMKRRLYKHRLQLIHEFYREKRYYHVRGKNDKWAVRNFMGVDLMGQTNVLLEDEPIVDVGIAKRQGVEQGISHGTIDIKSQADKRRINRILEIPEDINEGPNLQDDLSQDEAVQWMDADVEPVIDEDGDDHQIHWDNHKVDLLRDEWQQAKEICGWNEVKKIVWGWKKEFEGLQAKEEMLLAQPPVPPVETMRQTDPRRYDAGMQMYQNDLKLQQQIQAMPKPVELRILFLWETRLHAAGFIPAPQPGAIDPGGSNRRQLSPEEALAKVLRLESHAAGHRYLAQMQAQAAAAGALAPAAPGGQENEQGNIPSPGEATSGGSGQGGAPPSAAAAA